jgi:predicted metal-dependent HD superfamily phosphohydrolase
MNRGRAAAGCATQTHRTFSQKPLSVGLTGAKSRSLKRPVTTSSPARLVTRVPGSVPPMKRAKLNRWLDLWRTLGATGDGAPTYRRLITAHAEPHRSYHNLLHIDECLQELDSARVLALQPEAVEAAIWFHDIVYDPSSAGNEEESARVAVDHLTKAGMAPAPAEQIRELILATKTHEPEPNTDAALLVDIDLAIFGRPSERFEDYERAIREEYFWVEPEVYGIRRAEILARFLARPFLYSTDFFRLKYEDSARRNLTRSLLALEETFP